MQKPEIVDVVLEDLRHPTDERPIIATAVLMKTGFRESDLEKTTEAILDAIHRQTDLVVAPEYSYSSINGPLGWDQFNIHLSRILEMSRKSDALIVPGTFEWSEGMYHNACYVVYQGRIVYIREKTIAPLVPLDFLGQRIGIEICIENTTGLSHKNGVRDLGLACERNLSGL